MDYNPNFASNLNLPGYPFRDMDSTLPGTRNLVVLWL